jgi:signal transduction histidine kinase
VLVDADRTQLEQVIANLAVNARDAMRALGDASSVAARAASFTLIGWARGPDRAALPIQPIPERL